MKLWMILIAALTLGGCSSSSKDKKDSAQKEAPELEKVTSFEGAQVTGLTVSEDGRIFASFPRWREDIPYSVVEVMPNGRHTPYPNPQWNNLKDAAGSYSFNTIQSVLAHNGSLWVLDPSNPLMKGVVGKPKLYQFDLATNRLKRTYAFPVESAPKNSYLNDVRIDDLAKRAYITDSGLGGIVVLDLKSGKSWRVLQNHESTKAEDIILKVEGEPFKMKGKPAEIHSDGIALSPDRQYLYFHALTGYTLYRVPTAMLSNPKIKSRQIKEAVEDLGETPAPDGMIFDEQGNLYMADLENNAVVYRSPGGEIRTLIQDKTIKWPDTFAIENGKNLLFTDSLLHATKLGEPVKGMSFPIYRVPLPTVQGE